MKKIVIVLMVIGVFLLNGCRDIKTTPSVQACIDELDARNLKPNQDFFSGVVLVSFKEDVTEDEATNIINSYGLDFESYFQKFLKQKRWGRIIVPADSEFEWICKLQENSNIEYAELNTISTIP